MANHSPRLHLSRIQMNRIVEIIFEQWKSQNVVTFKEDEKKALQSAIEAIEEDYQREAQLEGEVHKMLDELEKQHGGQFQRSKMYHLLKQKLAKEKNIIL